MNLVDDEEPPSISIMRMSLGEVKPREEGDHAMVEARNKDPSSSTSVEPSSSQVPQDQGHAHGDNHDHGMDQGEHKVKKLKKKHLKIKMMMMVNLFNLNTKCLIQEFIKVFNGIIPLTTSLGVFEKG